MDKHERMQKIADRANTPYRWERPWMNVRSHIIVPPKILTTIGKIIDVLWTFFAWVIVLFWCWMTYRILTDVPFLWAFWWDKTPKFLLIILMLKCSLDVVIFVCWLVRK